MNKTTLALVAAGLLGIVSAACSSGAETEDRLVELRSQRRALLIQFTSAQNAIRGYQAAALDEEGVRAAQDSFHAVFRSVAEREDPAAGELLDRAEALGHELELLSTPVILQQGEEDPRLSDEERRQVAEELAEVERRLRPVTDRAFTDPAVQASFSVLQDSVVAAILRQDPSAQGSMDLMASLERQILDIDAEIAALEDR